MKNSFICIVLWQAIFVTVCFANEFDPRFACDFSRDLCNWKNTNTSVMFKRNMGETGIDDTGPTAGHTDGSNTDYYIYLETYGSPRYAGLVSPKMGSACVVACFRFWYHMYGQYVNRIEVGLNHDNHPLFNRSGDNGNMWKCATVPITSCNDKQIYIRAYESQEGIKSQIAFDDLALAYVDNKLQCSETVCEVNGSDFTSSTIAMTSTTRTVSTLPVTSSTTLDFVPSSSGPPTTSTPTSRREPQ
ncbi:Enteropeptidase [Mizuhopecten yessoensis]|uniref:Enteropeptidase n=1 Tax=Mizuhopecten yessoensis TaxID=6573 RepID=A0A210Q556_MIZYE|nr:Enteropeptidase [Mizuhopecten yessoensis]